MIETRLERYCVKFATRIGFASAKLAIHPDVGFPGRIFFIPGGCPLLVLFKQANVVSALKEKQQQHLEFLKKYGYNAIFCDSLKVFLKALANLLENPALSQSQ